MNGNEPQLEDLDFAAVVESLVFASPDPVSEEELCRLIMETEEGLELYPTDIGQAIESLNKDYRENGRSFAIIQQGGGYTFATGKQYYKWLQKFQHENVSRKLTPSAVEVLAILAYKQPVTKPEVDHIRGVDSGYLVRQLLEKELIKVAGRSERPGRPLLYRTTSDFLKHFGINSIDELPRPREIDDILRDDDMAEHRQLMLELKAELANHNHVHPALPGTNGNGASDSEEILKQNNDTLNGNSSENPNNGASN